MAKGRFVLVDEVDADLAMFNWSGDRYAERSGGKKNSHIRLHVEVARRMGIAPTSFVDHINRNKFDCRRSNLREATRAQNNSNGVKSTTARTASGFRGVHAHRSMWQARIQVGGKPVHLGNFPDRDAAARAYDIAAQQVHGAFAVLNFPKGAA
jgi:hypothetical protein